jgi:hypothetical protein
LTVAAHTLEKSIKVHMAPTLREDGFSGSGRAFRRRVEDMIHLVQVQGSVHGRKFAVNLGLHPACIPVQGGIPFQKMMPMDCALSRRLSTEGSDQWWEFGATSASMDSAVAQARAVYVDVGRKAFAELSGANSPLRVATPSEFEKSRFDFSGFKTTDVMMAKTLALMRLAAGNAEDACGFAQIALDNLGSASGLRRELIAITQGTWRKEDW